MNGEDQGDFEATYRTLPDDALLQLSFEGGLNDQATAALRIEMQRRSLSTKNAKGLKNWREKQVPAPPVRQRTVAGIGILFGGHKFMSDSDKRQGIFVATEFAVLRGLPIFPIGSYRVEDGGNHGLPKKIERIALQRDQVWQEMRWTLLFFGIGLIAAAVMIWSDEHKRAADMILRRYSKH